MKNNLIIKAKSFEVAKDIHADTDSLNEILEQLNKFDEQTSGFSYKINKLSKEMSASIGGGVENVITYMPNNIDMEDYGYKKTMVGFVTNENSVMFREGQFNVTKAGLSVSSLQSGNIVLPLPGSEDFRTSFNTGNNSRRLYNKTTTGKGLGLVDYEQFNEAMMDIMQVKGNYSSAEKKAADMFAKSTSTSMSYTLREIDSSTSFNSNMNAINSTSVSDSSRYRSFVVPIEYDANKKKMSIQEGLGISQKQLNEPLDKQGLSKNVKYGQINYGDNSASLTYLDKDFNIVGGELGPVPMKQSGYSNLIKQHNSKYAYFQKAIPEDMKEELYSQLNTLKGQNYGSIREAVKGILGNSGIEAVYEQAGVTPVNYKEIGETIEGAIDTISMMLHKGIDVKSHGMVGSQTTTVQGHQGVDSVLYAQHPQAIHQVHSQRYAQSISSLNTANVGGEDLGTIIESNVRGFSKISETAPRNEQFERLVEQKFSQAGIKTTTSNTEQLNKVLYAYSDLSFQDSSASTVSAAMRNIGQYEGTAKSVSMSLDDIKRIAGVESYEDITHEMIESILSPEIVEKRNKVTELNGVIKERFGVINESYKDVDFKTDVPSYMKYKDELYQSYNKILKESFNKTDEKAVLDVFDKTKTKQRGLIKGVDYANYSGYSIDNGIVKYNFDGMLMIGESTKIDVGAARVKSTVQNIFPGMMLDFGDGMVEIDQIFNPKFTSEKRGFALSTTTDVINTMAVNLMNYGNVDNPELSTKSNAFAYTKKLISDSTTMTTGAGKQTNIFNLFGFDIDYKNGNINIDDKNLRSLLDSGDYNYANLSKKALANIKEAFGYVPTNEELRPFMDTMYKKMLSTYEKTIANPEIVSKSNYNEARIVIGSLGGSETFDIMTGYVSKGEYGVRKADTISHGLRLVQAIRLMKENKSRTKDDAFLYTNLADIALSKSNNKAFRNLAKASIVEQAEDKMLDIYERSGLYYSKSDISYDISEIEDYGVLSKSDPSKLENVFSPNSPYNKMYGSFYNEEYNSLNKVELEITGIDKDIFGMYNMFDKSIEDNSQDIRYKKTMLSNTIMDITVNENKVALETGKMTNEQFVEKFEQNMKRTIGMVSEDGDLDDAGVRKLYSKFSASITGDDSGANSFEQFYKDVTGKETAAPYESVFGGETVLRKGEKVHEFGASRYSRYAESEIFGSASIGKDATRYGIYNPSEFSSGSLIEDVSKSSIMRKMFGGIDGDFESSTKEARKVSKTLINGSADIKTALESGITNSSSKLRLNNLDFDEFGNAITDSNFSNYNEMILNLKKIEKFKESDVLSFTGEFSKYSQKDIDKMSKAELNKIAKNISAEGLEKLFSFTRDNTTASNFFFSKNSSTKVTFDNSEAGFGFFSPKTPMNKARTEFKTKYLNMVDELSGIDEDLTKSIFSNKEYGKMQDIYSIRKVLEDRLSGKTNITNDFFVNDQAKRMLNIVDTFTSEHDLERRNINKLMSFAGVKIKKGDKESTETLRELVRRMSTLTRRTELDYKNTVSSVEASFIKNVNEGISGLGGKEGAIRALTQTRIESSSVISPREGANMFKHIVSEYDEVIGDTKTKAYKEFVEATDMVFGKELSVHMRMKLNEFRSNAKDGANFFETATNYLNENFSGVVIGTEKDWAKANRLDDFSVGKKTVSSIPLYLSRNPHAYEGSIAASRGVMLDEKNRNLSYLKYMFGDKTQGEATVGSLSFIGKMTALRAWGDFDGDTFALTTLNKNTFKFTSLDNEGKRKAAQAMQVEAEMRYKAFNFAHLDYDEFKNIIEADNDKLRDEIGTLFVGGKELSFHLDEAELHSFYKSTKFSKDFIRDVMLDENAGYDDFGKFNKTIYKLMEQSGMNNTNTFEEVLNTINSLDPKTKTKLFNTKLNEMIASGSTDSELIKTLELGDSTTENLEKIRKIKTFLQNENAGKDIKKDIIVMKEIFGDTKTLVDSQLALLSKSTYSSYTGISETGKVHSTLTNFRNMMSSIQGNAKDFISGNEQEKALLRFAEQGIIYENYDKLIEELAISAKQGSGATSVDDVMNLFKISSRSGHELSSQYLNEISSMMEQLSEDKNSGKTAGEILGKGFNLDIFNRLLYNEKYGPLKTSFDVGYKTNIEDLARTITKGVDVSDIGKLDPKSALTMLSGITSAIVFKGLNLSEDGATKLHKVTNSATQVFENSKGSPMTYAGSIINRTLELFGRDPATLALKQTEKKNAKLAKANIINSVVSDRDVNAIDEMISKESEIVSNITTPANVKHSGSIGMSLDEISSNVKYTEDPAVDVAISFSANESLETHNAISKDIQNKADAINSQHIENESIGYEPSFKQNEVVEDVAPVSKIKLETPDVNMKQIADEIEEIADAAASVDSNTKKQLANTTNEASKFDFRAIIRNNKKLLIGTGAAAVLGTAFSLVQKNRAVISIDIDEKQYDPKDGSVIRNIGNYDINTNIRGFY